MLTAGDALYLISVIEGSVWNLLTITVTVNVAVLGWLIQRHGLHGFREKSIASIGYTGFVLSIVFGIQNAYSKLDMAANDLAFIYIEKDSSTNQGISNSGLVSSYISRSPEYCGELRKFLEISECSQYSNYKNINLSFIFVGWLFINVLFWFEGLWLSGRER